MERAADSAFGRVLASCGKGVDRDRAVDESANQLAVFGRCSARPLNREEAERLYLRDATVPNRPPTPAR